MNHLTVGVHLHADVAAEIDALGARLGLSRSRTAAIAIVWGLGLLKAGQGVDPVRLVGHIEYIHAALDLLVEREHPDIHARLDDIAVERLERHHG
ncbi:hypothetical protein EWE75_17050 [Sphingomonas populi]|uniref:Ribbon-helix-helix protein, CopG family n=1 Tax=Sphingomonas populi TaxID=2484750 RepID=A0A4Q6XS26_9SPHN|nr:hypothetical protein [Sphingomonas populi]RZF63253.1 hypothetical protein EWE75_17050 [Sphingomonas populi]